MESRENLKAYIDGELEPSTTEKIRGEIESAPGMKEDELFLRAIGNHLRAAEAPIMVKGEAQALAALARTRPFAFPFGKLTLSLTVACVVVWGGVLLVRSRTSQATVSPAVAMNLVRSKASQMQVATEMAKAPAMETTPATEATTDVNKISRPTFGISGSSGPHGLSRAKRWADGSPSIQQSRRVRSGNWKPSSSVLPAERSDSIQSRVERIVKNAGGIVLDKSSGQWTILVPSSKYEAVYASVRSDKSVELEIPTENFNGGSAIAAKAASVKATTIPTANKADQINNPGQDVTTGPNVRAFAASKTRVATASTSPPSEASAPGRIASIAMAQRTTSPTAAKRISEKEPTGDFHPAPKSSSAGEASDSINATVKSSAADRMVGPSSRGVSVGKAERLSRKVNRSEFLPTNPPVRMLIVHFLVKPVTGRLKP